MEVAIVGSGPSGFYAAEALLEACPQARVSMYERLPVPFGLVRFGVAPDHPKLKSSTLIFDRVAQHPNFRFIGNVTIGRDLSVEELRQYYHAVIFSYGAESDRSLGIPGETLPGSHTATEFVGWYNGHPDYRNRAFDLEQDSVAIIGQGNVAADVARILATPIKSLESTDIATHAISALCRSKIRTLHIIGRRGPAQAKFTSQELRELGEIPNVSVHMNAADLDMNPESLTELQDRKNFLAAKNVELFRKWSSSSSVGANRQIHFHFLESPAEIFGKDRVEGLILEKNRLIGPAFGQQAAANGERRTLNCGLVFRSIGYKGVGLPGLPFDSRRGVLPNAAGRLLDHADFYATGWIKRGPSGIIGTNRACATETVATLLQDLAGKQLPRKEGTDSCYNLLAHRGIRVVSYQDWKRIDTEEIQRGASCGKPREKFTKTEDMLAMLSPFANS